MFNNETMQILVTALLAAFGGLARLMSQKDKNVIKISNVISCCLVASFSGVLAYFAAGYFSLDQNVTYIIASISGWLGPQVIDIFTNMVLQKSGLNLLIDTEEKLGNNSTTAEMPVTELVKYPNSENAKLNAHLTEDSRIIEELIKEKVKTIKSKPKTDLQAEITENIFYLSMNDDLTPQEPVNVRSAAKRPRKPKIAQQTEAAENLFTLPVEDGNGIPLDKSVEAKPEVKRTRKPKSDSQTYSGDL